jgi:uncharacterized protein YndB with AHSA1/START domain
VISFETSVRIDRSIEDVFAFVSDPLLFPQWNSAVQTVRVTSGEPGGLGSTYSMQREIATGRVKNRLEVLRAQARHHVRYSHDFGTDAVSLPLPIRL